VNVLVDYFYLLFVVVLFFLEAFESFADVRDGVSEHSTYDKGDDYDEGAFEEGHWHNISITHGKGGDGAPVNGEDISISPR
jgi:hypothetical protein